jgi:hypothetical protein
MERYPQTLKGDANQVPRDVPGELKVAIGKFVEFYNRRRYHKALNDNTPADVLAGKRDETLGRRRQVKRQDGRTTGIIQPRPQGATRNSLISPLPNPSHSADVQQRAAHVERPFVPCDRR